MALRGSIWPDACAVAIRRLSARLTERSNGPDLTTKNSANQGVRHMAHKDVTELNGGDNSNLRSTSSNPTRLPQRQHTEIPSPRTDHHPVQERQGSVSTRGASVALQENPDSSIRRNTGSSYESAPRPGNSSSLPEPPPQNVAFSGPSSLAGLQWNSSGIGQQLSDIPMPNDDVADLFCGYDLPFWMGDDQFLGLGGSL